MNGQKQIGIASCAMLLLLAASPPATAGELFVLQSLYSNLVTIDETGTQIDTFANNFWGAEGVAVSPQGDIYVSDNDLTIKRYQPDGTYLGVFASGFASPGDIAFDAAGVLYVPENDFSDDQLFRFLPDGTPLPPVGAGVLNEPYGVDVDSAGRIYVGEDLGPIELFDAAGNYLGEFAVNPAQGVRGIAIDSNDNLYVTSTFAGRIDKFDSGGNHLGMFADNVPGAWAIDVDENDNVYATARNIGTVEHFSPSGAYLGAFATGLGLPSGMEFGLTAAPASAGLSDGLTVAHAGGGDLLLGWAPSCQAGDSDYAVYEGTLGSYTSHVDRTCSTAGATTWTLTPSAGDRYYLVVPNNGGREGSYGLDSSGVERGQGAVACLVQQAACP